VSELFYLEGDRGKEKEGKNDSMDRHATENIYQKKKGNDLPRQI
jgi:hypothetical protein